LFFTSVDPKTGPDIWVLPLEGDRKPAPFLRTEFNEDWASISPDGHWIAYQSNESSRPEVYVRPFSPPGSANSSSARGKWQVSKAGGGRPHWRGDGKELFYFSADAKLMAVDVSANAAFQAGIPQPLFNLPPNADPRVTPDGKRFLIAAPPQQSTAEVPITMLLNWPALLKR
jgi:eukaryotic-like serine/threonine-protein kinase